MLPLLGFTWKPVLLGFTWKPVLLGLVRVRARVYLEASLARVDVSFRRVFTSMGPDITVLIMVVFT